MRLVCPNCNAQYEVDPAVIPEEGRDVLCSACGHAWFQHSEAALARAEAVSGAVAGTAAEAVAAADAVADPAVTAEAGAETAATEGAAAQDTPDLAPDAAQDDALAVEGVGDPAEAEVHGPVTAEAEESWDATEAAAETATDTGQPEAEQPDAGQPETGADMAPSDAPLSDTPSGMVPSGMAPVAEDHPGAAVPVAEAGATIPSDGQPSDDLSPADPLAVDPMLDDHALPAADQAPLPRRTLDDAMMQILREEAEREALARREEGSSLDTQPDLGLEGAAAAAVPVAAAIGAATVRALRRGPDDDGPAQDGPAGEPAAATAKGRALLPDIEVINSTLTASSDRHDIGRRGTAAEEAQRTRSGFRAGFSVALLVALLLLGLYTFAPGLSRVIPALAPALERYVAAVDHGRIWLDDRMRSPGGAEENSGG
jgi:predicted Zn finger-like uncharacterized protein